jgi:hypothetical protein
MCCAGPCLDVFFPILKAPVPLVVRRLVFVMVLGGVVLLLMRLKEPYRKYVKHVKLTDQVC